jgi:adenylosuccinate synthase
LRAYIIVDLGFGDSGKGILTDFLARRFNAGVVVRYNGGAQAGHNVIAPDGRQHTFSQFGSGTFVPGVKTYLSRYMVIHPGALLVEGEALEKIGVRDAFSRIRISEEALVITPFHQAANHIREIARGKNQHGSCGVGVGEAVEDSLLNTGDCVRAGDLANLPRLKQKLQSVRERKREQLRELCGGRLQEDAFAREWEIFEREEVIDAWISMISPIGALGLVTPDQRLKEWLNKEETVIFEGAQGVLLDADAGFHPYTTWSRCTSENAFELIREAAPGSQVFQIGVMRSYAVRHGPGPFPTETDALAKVISEHNTFNVWQGKVRYGWFDAVLARYALSVCGKLDALAVTHLDVLPRLEAWKYCPGYADGQGFCAPFVSVDRSGGLLTGFRLPGDLSLAQREKFTRALSSAAPVFETCASQNGNVIEKIEELAGLPVGLVSNGPKAENVKITNSLLE